MVCVQARLRFEIKMAKDKQNKKQNENTLFKDLRDKIQHESTALTKIPSIMEFVENKRYLGLPYKLFDLQKLILKCFYRGSQGNEDLTLTAEDINLINANGLNSVEKGNLIEKWNSGHDFRELVLVWGRRCLSEDCEIVETRTGKIWRLGDLWNFGKTKVDSWTYDEENEVMTMIPNANLVYQGKKDVFRVQTASGHEIEITDNHPMLTNRGWKNLKDLRVKDKIAIAASQPFFGHNNELNVEQGALLGYISSNCFDSTGSYIATVLRDGSVFEDFKKKLKSLRTEMLVEVAENRNIKSFDERKYSYIYSPKDNYQDSENIITLLQQNGLKNKSPNQKFVPARIFSAPKDVIASYLRSFFSADCSLTCSKSNKFTCKIEIKIYSHVLAKQIQHLLSRFGIFSTIQNKLNKHQTAYQLLINKNIHVKTFIKEIGLLNYQEESQQVLEKTNGAEDLDTPVFSPIILIKKIGAKRTFDIQVSHVSHLQNFVANGFICHNCISEDAELTDARTGEKFTFKQAWRDEKIVSSWTYDEKQKEMVIIDDCNIISQGRRTVYKIKDSFNNEIEVTDNHPFLTQRGWVECKDLKDGDKLSIAITSPVCFGDSKAISEDEAAILGYITGDGCCSQASIFFTAKNEEIRSDLEKRLNKISDNLELVQDTWTKADSKKYAYKIRSREFVSLAYYDEEKQRKISTRDKNDLAKLLIKHNLMGKNSHDKQVPDELFNCPKNVIAAYLKALFSCDGWIMSKKVRNKYCPLIGFATSNGQQSILVAKLLSKFGIFANIRRKKTNTKITTEGKLYKYNNVISFELYFTKQKDILLFMKEIGFVGKDLNVIDNVIKLAKNTNSNNVKNRFLLMTDFISKEELGEKETFDLQVSDKKHIQNFTCNNIIVSNSGKDFLCSIIALYEAMRLLEIPGGDPYRIYNLGSATPFTILTIANSSSQAKILFREIKDKVLQSEYFRDKILPEGVTADGIHFLTPEDKKRNEDLTEKGFAPNLGSIVVRSGHSNSDTLVGISCYVLLLDEIGLYKNTAGASSGDAIFNSLAPAVKTYVREVPRVDKTNKPILDESGKQIIDKIYDGKIICLSTPRGKEGIFYDLYYNHDEVDHRLICQAATWQVNPMQSKEGLMAAFPSMPEEKFRMEFGAEFSGTAGENFFPEEAIEACFADKNLKLRDFGMPGAYYFAHLDPATSSHNYALLVAHKETYFDRETMKKDWRIVVDHIKYWSPSPGKPILVDEVDEYVAQLNGRFCLGVVTYDHFNSQVSIEKLRKKGVPTKMTPYTKRYKNIIYDNLYQLVIQKKLVIPNHLLLKNEMKNIQRKWLNSGYKVYPKRDGDVVTDDIVDALAGACYNCIEKEVDRLPQGKLINLPVNGNNDIVWRSMQGTPYGTGPGGKVASDLEKRASYPRRGV